MSYGRRVTREDKHSPMIMYRHTCGKDLKETKIIRMNNDKSCSVAGMMGDCEACDRSAKLLSTHVLSIANMTLTKKTKVTTKLSICPSVHHK